MLLALGALTAGCLSPPPTLSSGDAGTGNQADAGTTGACASSLSIDFTSDAQLDGWTRERDADCDMAVQNGELVFSNDGEPAACRVYRDAQIDMIAGTATVRLSTAGGGLPMGFVLVLKSGPSDFDQRRALYIERDDGVLYLGDCAPICVTNGVCDDNCRQVGAVDFDPTANRWWRFRHDSAARSIVFETSSDGQSYQRIPTTGAVDDVTDDMVSCVGVELGSEEDAAGTSDQAAFDDLSIGR